MAIPGYCCDNRIVIMVSTSPAARKPTPNGGPWKNGRAAQMTAEPFLDRMSHDPVPSHKSHKPIMTLGIAASISMIKEAGPFSQLGASSTRKIAAPKLIGYRD